MPKKINLTITVVPPRRAQLLDQRFRDYASPAHRAIKWAAF